ncbi:MAG: hypothetical protein HY353_05435 [Candidatus Omnitrophica bacterium]|nr:hypothetical protein [Candidatus Omnitrophota bacterium]
MRMCAAVVVGACALLTGTAGAEIHSDDPAVHLNYATILFYKGRGQMGQGQADAATVTFQEMEAELNLAMTLSERDADDQRRQLLRSQTAFLLGDLHFFVFKERDKAKAFYEESIKNFPEHHGAAEALKRFE